LARLTPGPELAAARHRAARAPDVPQRSGAGGSRTPLRTSERPRFDTRRIVSEVGLTALIVDDNAPFRDAARQVVEAAGLEVVAEAQDGPAALAAASAWRPDVVLLDMRLPGVDGIEVARRLAAGQAPPIVVLMSAGDVLLSDGLVGAARVRGFLPKDRLHPQTLRALLD
jgi:CheY-like chemotaxis protein